MDDIRKMVRYLYIVMVNYYGFLFVRSYGNLLPRRERS